LSLARVDYEDSLYLSKAARHPNAVYLMCQAIEKLLKGPEGTFEQKVTVKKGIQVELASRKPNKTHNLELLGRQSTLPFSQQQFTFLDQLATHYDRVRYRDIAQTDYNTKAKVEPIIKQAKDLYLWILKNFVNP